MKGQRLNPKLSHPFPPLALPDVQRNGVDALVQVPQRGLYGAVASDSGHGRKSRCPYHDTEMTVARTIVARVTCVLVAFVDNLQLVRRESRRQPRGNFVFHSHVTLTPFNLPGKALR